MMDKKQKMVVSASKTIYTFAWLRQVSWHLYKEAEKQVDGWLLDCMASQIFSAFCVEACLNHVGKRMFLSWDAVERSLNPEPKLELIAERLKIRLDYGKRPYQTFRAMFVLRNALAHGKTETVKQQPEEVMISWDEIPQLPETKWERKISLEQAKIFMDDSSAICRELLKLSADEEYLFYNPEISDWVKKPVDKEGHDNNI